MLWLSTHCTHSSWCSDPYEATKYYLRRIDPEKNWSKWVLLLFKWNVSSNVSSESNKVVLERRLRAKGMETWNHQNPHKARCKRTETSEFPGSGTRAYLNVPSFSAPIFLHALLITITRLWNTERINQTNFGTKLHSLSKPETGETALAALPDHSGSVPKTDPVAHSH